MQDSPSYVLPMLPTDEDEDALPSQAVLIVAISYPTRSFTMQSISHIFL